VDVPAASRLALAGLRPNPAPGTNLRVAFSLPNAGPARLQLIDVSGRRIGEREVGSLGAGEHLESIPTDGPVAAGLYWVRLERGGRSMVARAVITN
jgi:hypothetical protein